MEKKIGQHTKSTPPHIFIYSPSLCAQSFKTVKRIKDKTCTALSPT